MTTNTLRDELDTYKQQLLDAQTRLLAYQARNADRNTQADQLQVLLTAVDGLLAKLTQPDLSDQIALNEIVDLCDKVGHVVSSVSLFLSRQGASVS